MKTSRRKKRVLAAGRRVVNFPQAQGKVLEQVEFSTMTGAHSITLTFRDKTALRFGLEPGFTLFADYADWKTGDEEMLREWRPVRSELFRK